MWLFHVVPFRKPETNTPKDSNIPSSKNSIIHTKAYWEKVQDNLFKLKDIVENKPDKVEEDIFLKSA
jgi:hypothetical protein